jgi:WD40 repeat protein
MKLRPSALLLLTSTLSLSVVANEPATSLSADQAATKSTNTVAPATSPTALNTANREDAVPAWDYAALAEWRRIPAEAPIKSVAISPDGKIIAGGGDGKVYLWNEVGELLLTIVTEPQLLPEAPKAKPEDDLLGQKRPTPPAGQKWIRLMVFSPDGKVLATAGADSTVKLWNMENGQWIRTIAGHQDIVTSLVFTPDSRAIATGSMDKNVRLWNTANGQLLGTLSQHVYPIRAVAFSKDLSTLISVGGQGRGRKNGELKFWNIAGKGELKQELTIDGLAPESAQLVADGRILASAADFRRPAVKLWDGESGKFVRNTVPGYSSGIAASTLTFTPDFRVVAGGSLRTGKHSVVYLWEVRTGKIVKIIRAAPQNGLAFSPDGRVLAVAGEDKSVQLWRVP